MLYLVHFACFIRPKQQRLFALMMPWGKNPEIRIIVRIWCSCTRQIEKGKTKPFAQAPGKAFHIFCNLNYTYNFASNFIKIELSKPKRRNEIHPQPSASVPTFFTRENDFSLGATIRLTPKFPAELTRSLERVSNCWARPYERLLPPNATQRAKNQVRDGFQQIVE